MKFINIKRIIGLVALFSIAGLVFASVQSIRADDSIMSPDIPPQCSNLQVPFGNKITSHLYALGVQVYRWNGTSWDFVAPIAYLYANNSYQEKVGFHYADRTGGSKSGSKVVAAKLADCSTDSNSIPWLLLQTVSTEGSGIFTKVTYIQRINTQGGLSPTTPGSFIGEVAKIPYTAEYYFYRSDD